MKYTDAESDKLIEQLAASTRSPRGRFSAGNSYPRLEKQLFRRSLFRLPRHSFTVAATVALVCLSAWMVFHYLQPATIQTVSTLAETRAVRLPDGTSVTLNRFSSLSYPKHFKSAVREVTLNGEAYFEVAKDSKHPFIVQTDSIHVQVLGTHFNIDAYHNNQCIRTTLLEGSVAVSNKNNTERLILQPNEMAVYNKADNSLVRKVMENATDETAWRCGELMFSSMPLQDIMRRLSNLFSTEIQIPDTALQNYRITARFPSGEKLGEILTKLREAGYFNYTETNNSIILTPQLNSK